MRSKGSDLPLQARVKLVNRNKILYELLASVDLVSSRLGCTKIVSTVDFPDMANDRIKYTLLIKVRKNSSPSSKVISESVSLIS
jgi:hypothetical protein